MTGVFTIKLDDMQPSQLFISSEKLSQVMEDFSPVTFESIPPVPVKEIQGKTVLTDGHTRALAAFMHGLSEIRAFRDEDDLDWGAYEVCVDWCKNEGIHAIADLRDRIVSRADYERLWLNRCAEMQRQLQAERGRE